MKHFLQLLVVSVFLMFPGMRQTTCANVHVPEQVYMPLDSVPDWVKVRVTPDEYKLWKELSRYFQVDYSILRQDLSGEQNAYLYRSIRELIEAVEAGIYSKDSLYGYFTFQPPAGTRSVSVEANHVNGVDYSGVECRCQVGDKERQDRCGRLDSIGEQPKSGKKGRGNESVISTSCPVAKTLVPFCSRTIVCREKKVILYTDTNGYDAHLVLTLVYEVDERNGEVVVLKKEVHPFSFSGIEVEVEACSQNLDLKYLSGAGCFKGDYESTMKVVDPVGEHHIEQVNVSFFIEL